MTDRIKAHLTHLSSQLVYVYCSFTLFSLKRELSWYLICMALSIGLYGVTRFLNRVKTENSVNWFLSALLIGNSVFLNLEGHNAWTYLAAVTVGILGMSIFRIGETHVFNPSVIGVLTVVMLWPERASFGEWAQTPWFSLTILVLGTITIINANRVRLSYGYIFAYILTGLLVYYIHRLIGTPSYNIIKPMFWPLTIASTSSLIFIHHVITDPITSPKSNNGQWAFGASIGILDASLRGLSFLPAAFVAYVIIQIIHANSPMLFDSIGTKVIGKINNLMPQKIYYIFDRIKIILFSKIVVKGLVVVLIFISGMSFGMTYWLDYLRSKYDPRISVKVTPEEMYKLVYTMKDVEVRLRDLLLAAEQNDMVKAEKLAADGAINYMAEAVPWIGVYMPKEFRSLAQDGHNYFGETARLIRSGSIDADKLKQRVRGHIEKCMACHATYRYDYTLFRVQK